MTTSRPTKNPWGRPLSECVRPKVVEEGVRPTKTAFGRPLPPAVPRVVDFREVGLSESDAKEAAEGLERGDYLSFEDACLSRAIFGPSKSVQLDEDLMRKKARSFAESAKQVQS